MITFSLAIFDTNIKDNDVFSMSGQDLGMGKGLGPEIRGVLYGQKRHRASFFLVFFFWYFVVFVVLSPYTEWKRQIIEIITVILFVPGNKKALFRLENKIFNSLGKCNVFCSSMDCNQRKPFWRSKMAII